MIVAIWHQRGKL